MSKRMTMMALLCVGSAALAGPVPIAPAATRFPLGAFTLVPLRDMLNVVPNDGSVFGKDRTTAAVASVLTAAGASTRDVTLGVDALLVEEPGRTVLIDTGLGPKVGGALMQSLAQAGIAPAKITDILITHSHGDHVGGLVTAAGALAFPNATIRMSAPEWTFMQRNAAQTALVSAIAPKVVTFAPGSPVVPGIEAVALAGHTPGHSGYRITSRGAQLTDIGDTAHSSIVSLAEPRWTIGYDTDTIQGRATREKELESLAAGHQRIFAPHFPYPGIGTIVARGGGYAFIPAPH
ncbi:MBL fold metallo-hydrolase [uncultured Sphingomonas sp.]|uniref:MBL fold metallo-hydrolase n=1 Tax=uncultured Sphingomonas sp. TaxID=158754 RepID=UPI0035C961A3